MTEFRPPPLAAAKLLVREKMRSSQTSVYSLPALRRIIDSAITPWPYDSKRPSTNQIIEELIAEKAIRHIILRSKEYPPISRYAHGTISMLELATSLKFGAYLSHGTAADIHGISAQHSPTFYANKEQSPKPAPKGKLSQEAIDRAFANKQRQSKYIYQYEEQNFTLLAGKYTQDYGVETLSINGRGIRVTNLWRTLIDIAVRPAYAGGVRHVAAIFKKVVKSVDVANLVKTLEAVGHKYPFHQAVGYYLSLAGLQTSNLEELKKLGLSHRFYLEYGMTDTQFDDEWQIYVPSELARRPAH